MKKEKLCETPYNAKISPIEKVTQTLRTVPLNNALPATEPREVEHVLRELLHAVLQTNEASVDDVNTVTHRVGYVFLHEAAET